MSSTVTDQFQPSAPPRAPKPLVEGAQGTGVLVALWAFVVVPFLALLAAAPVAWGRGLSGLDVAMGAAAYVVCAFGIGVGFHRHLTHGSFKARRWLRILLTLAGSAAIEGGPIQWVADHRRHHAFADRQGDPHSPWRYGTSLWGLARGLFHAHAGWLFRREMSNRARFAPDLLADRDVTRIDRLFPLIVAVSVLWPAVVGGLATWSVRGALTGLFWAGLVRIAVLHHAEPTCARHGVDRGQVDINARLIWLFERAGWAWDVRWPGRDRLASRRRAPAGTMGG